MNNFVIKLRSECNSSKMRYYVNSFVRNARIKGRYIKVQLKIITENNQTIDLGNNYLIDIGNNSELEAYRYYVRQTYEAYTNNYDSENIIKIQYVYINLKKADYLNQIKNMSL